MSKNIRDTAMMLTETNFAEWKRAYLIRATSISLEAGRALSEGKDKVFEMPDPTTVDETNMFSKLNYTTMFKETRAKQVKYLESRAEIVSDMIQEGKTISKSALSKARANAGFSKAVDEMDPISLMKVYKTTHSTGNPHLATYYTKQFEQIQQNNSETFGEYCERLETSFETLQELGETVSDIRKKDKITFRLNNSLQPIIEQMKLSGEITSSTVTFESLKKHITSIIAIKFADNLTMMHTSKGSTYSAVSPIIKRNRPCKHCGGEHLDKECQSSANNNNNKGNMNVPVNNSSSCIVCDNSTHTTSDCRTLSRNIVAIRKLCKDKRDEYVNSKPKSKGSAAVATYQSSNQILGLVSANAIAFVQTSPMNTKTILLDTAASHSIVADKSMLTNVRQLQTPIQVRGIKGATVTAKLVGTFHQDNWKEITFKYLN